MNLKSRPNGRRTNTSVKKRAKKVALFAMTMFTALSLNSCRIIIDNTGFLYLQEEEKKKVVPCRDAIENLPNDGRIYLVTKEQLQQYLDSRDKVLIYEYRFFCRSEHCVNPAIVEKACKERNIDFCLMAVSYGSILFNLPEMRMPILSINPEPYGKSIYKECSEKFFNELTNTTFKTRGYGCYFLFEKGEYKGCFDEFMDALK